MNPLFQNLKYNLNVDVGSPGWDQIRMGITDSIGRSHGTAHVLSGVYRSLPEGQKFDDLVQKMITGVTMMVPLAKEFCLDKDGCRVRNVVFADGMGQSGYSLMALGKTGVILGAVSDRQDQLDTVAKVFMENTTAPKEAPGTVYALQSSGGNLNFKPMPGQAHSPIVEENYNVDVLTAFARIREELVAKTPKGRITIVDGPPGTGKTYFLRSLLAELCSKTRFIVVAPADLPDLANPSGLSALLSFKSDMQTWSDNPLPITLIVEDGDACVAPRDGGNNSAVAAVLNMADGLMGQLLDLRILLTTNAKRQDLDEAIVRAGRLSTNLHIGKLTEERAVALYQRLGGPVPAPDLSGRTLAQVYQLATDPQFTSVRVGASPLGYRA